MGPSGLDLVFAGSFYSHTDEQADAEGKGDPGSSQWATAAGRTWGTSGLEGQITEESETISITGKGISDNLAGVLGEDVIQAIAGAVACALQPAQPRCLSTVQAGAAAGAVAIGKLVDGDKWQAVVELEKEHKQLIKDAATWIEEAEEGGTDG